MIGKVKWFNSKKRFGFLVLDNGQVDVFVHASDVVGNQPLREGEAVTFEMGQDERGRQKATSVKRLD